METYIANNDKVIGSIKTNVETNTKHIKAFQDEVKTMKTDLANLQQKYDESQVLLNKTTTILANFAKTVSKLDLKYTRDKEEQIRCQLIIDGAKEKGRPKTVVSNLLKDLGVKFSETDIKSAYRLGPVNDKATRPDLSKSSLFQTDLNMTSLHQIIHYLKDKIGVFYFRCCVIFDTL